MGFRIINRKLEIIIPVLLLCVSCTKVSTPKPYGYYRITVPDTAYGDFRHATGNAQLSTYPYTFALSRNAIVQPRNDEPYWINIFYPALDRKSVV